MDRDRLVGCSSAAGTWQLHVELKQEKVPFPARLWLTRADHYEPWLVRTIQNAARTPLGAACVSGDRVDTHCEAIPPMLLAIALEASNQSQHQLRTQQQLSEDILEKDWPPLSLLLCLIE